MLDGYPRSGNTFSIHLIHNIFQEKNLVHHFHCIAPIKIALDKELPVFILIREPKEAITSLYLKKIVMWNERIPQESNLFLLNKLTKEYVEYYSFIKTHESKITIVPFDKLIANPIDVMDKINEKVYDDFYKISDKLMTETVNSYNGSKGIYGSDKPNKEKEELKNGLKRKLLNLDIYPQASKIYKAVI